MQIPLEWLNDLIDIKKVSLDKLIEKLTLGGFEVEEILEVAINNKKQIVLDVSATANRSDSLSIQGISSEIAGLLNKPIRKSFYTKQILEWKENINRKRSILSPNSDCSIFLTILINNIDNFTIPSWIQEKLISAGVTPTNGLGDFQTYILLETGYPFTFYDLGKIQSKLNNFNFDLSISTAKNNQEFFAANNLHYKLNDSNLLVKANDLPISIAGIIENKEFLYSETTNSLLIEGSIFNAAKIRQQSRYLGVRTDQSARYEKSLKNTYLIESFYRLISLLRIKNPKLTCKIHTFLQLEEPSFKKIQLRYQTINEVLGPTPQLNKGNFIFISPEMVTSYLERLNFEFSYNQSKFIWDVQIPHLRSDDITREIDLIEEIGRLHGFNNFWTSPPKIKRIGTEDLSYKTRKKITSCFLNLGLHELIHYSLSGQGESSIPNEEINLINPLLSDYATLRTSLLPNLLGTVKENLKQSNRIIEGFEYGHVFSGDIEKNFNEIEYVAGIFGGTKQKLAWSESEKKLTWFEAKGKIEQFLKQLNILVYWDIGSMNKLLHPYRNANLYLLNGNKVGQFGQVHPVLANKMELMPETYLFEFKLKEIQDQLKKNKLPVYKEYSVYPRIVKDLSFILSDNIPFHALEKTLYLNGTKFLSEINLLDEYRGESIPDHCTSLCFQLVFQSNEKTLQNKEIESIISNLQLVLVNNFNATIRN